MEETCTGQKHNNYVELVLKQVKDFTLKFPITASFFLQKEFLNLYNVILVSFPSGGCVDVVVDNQRNYQEYKYVYFLQYHTLTYHHTWWCKYNQS